MSNIELVTPLRLTYPGGVTPALAPDADFEGRWAAWVGRGRGHEQRVRRRLLIWAGVFTIGAAIAYAVLGS